MLCKIAELIVEIPEAGGLAPRCREYLYTGAASADITIRPEQYNLSQWEGLSYESGCYMESGGFFAHNLLRFDGMILHSSAVEYGGRAFLFSGPSTVGKSTHARLWQQTFGSAVQVINDDKPALRFVDDRWYAYGTPWCGKDGINVNRKVPLAGICFLKQAKQDGIRRLTAEEAIPRLLSQTTYRLRKVDNTLLLLSHLDKLVRLIPIYELACTADIAAARLSHDTMLHTALELGL